MIEQVQRLSDDEARTLRDKSAESVPSAVVPRRRPKTMEQAVKLVHVLQQIAAAAL